MMASPGVFQEMPGCYLRDGNFNSVQINEKMSVFDNAIVEKQIKRQYSAVKVDANFLRGTPAIADDETRAAPDDNRGLIAAVTTGPAKF